MKIPVFSSKPYTRRFFEMARAFHPHDLTYLETRLTADTVGLAKGFDGVCVFVNDQLNAEILPMLRIHGVRVVALRCAGFNNVDLELAAKLKIDVVRVPAYSPHAVAEHTVGLILSLNRNLHRAYAHYCNSEAHELIDKAIRGIETDE